MEELQRALLGLHPIELERLLAEALSRDNFRVTPSVGRDSGVDFIAVRGAERYAIQVVRSEHLTLPALERLNSKASGQEYGQFVIVFLGTTRPLIQNAARTHRVMVWGLREWQEVLDRSGLLATIAPRVQVRKSILEHGGAAFDREQAFDRRAEELLARLEAAPRGEQWAEYQELACEIAEYVFSPQLGPPERESADEPRRNRRDFVMENLADEGFWFRARQRYQADYVVFDAKNFTGAIGKKSIIEISHYLKPYGLGMFGVIFTRKPPSKAAIHAVREQWAGSGRMIAILSDNETRELLRCKQDGTAPEIPLSDWIAAMRKSM